ncbi:hypothetical protein MNBD_PLANCTO02-2914 [hydrothermal vent metagenome]|uniref:Uncharacterized protein n=1 Tax=hydrothermal vent metagenome TaxID=652676 RepID=A0A3B1DV07_9ZZZZ
MTIPVLQQQEDRNQQFNDWGKTVLFRQVTQAYNTQSGQITESYTDISLIAIVGSQPATPSKGTAGKHFTLEIYVMLKAEELPVTEPTVSSRIIKEEIEYDILSSTLSSSELVRTFHCRARI